VSDLWKIERPGARLIAALDSNVLLRGQWTDGHERACALAWMSREVRDAESAEACPATLMPQWAAEIIPWMDDAPSAEAWPGLMRRLGLLIDRATPQTWSRRLQAKWCQIAVVEALRHTTDAAVVEVCERVIVLLDRAIAGDEPSADEWKAAAAEAEAAAKAAAWAAWAAEAAWAAAEAAWAAWAAEAAWAAAEAAAWAAADRIAAGMLDALEKEIALNALEEPAK
jgi:hypothetical protein